MAKKDTIISVLGDGGWGTALTIGLAQKGIPVRLWGAFPQYVEEIRKRRENVKFLPGFKIPEIVSLESDISRACDGASLVVLAAPSQFMRSVLRKMKAAQLKQKNFVSVAKGIETTTLKTMSQVIHEELGPVSLCVLSGPCIAREVALKLPAAASVASHNHDFASEVRKLFASESFGLYESDDVLGVELGGSLKNVIAIGAGVMQGLGLGANTRAVLFARGLAEMARLGAAMGAKRHTFMGLSGLGDLATTCLSPLSRNRSFGEEIGKGSDLKTLLKNTEMVVEGVETARCAYALARKHQVSMPISESVYHILFKNHDPKRIVQALMSGGPHREMD